MRPRRLPRIVLSQTFLDRMVGIGDVTIFSTDSSTPVVMLKGLADAERVLESPCVTPWRRGETRSGCARANSSDSGPRPQFDRPCARLGEMVKTTASVRRRDGRPTECGILEILMETVLARDVVSLAAGDTIRPISFSSGHP
ncbi:PH domain-containing protein [Ramlibacter sp. MMS24-I3-19]|uniref:PH domain-containing protein n=1 Tax=Ramlibacter sp. MMS24-I3-19 TaxID=3416606 RepID=UPI003D009B1A